MAWPIPSSGQWTSGFTMTPDMSSYTPEQWALMQQQNWQQWAQWQQQYAQWQTQYGDKYAQQMQAFQAVAGFPPVPPTSVAPPPAPPPPDKPPPPPPHENDQPLYSKPNTNVALVPTPATQTQNIVQSSYSEISAGNMQNRSYNSDTHLSETQSQVSVNMEALKKLAEEERLFDIQFKKWEEEIQKWKRENVNHPDKAAYNEYEQKFEACRAQLLERRNQMKQKRARLMDNGSQAISSTTSGNKPSDITPIQNTNYSQNIQPNTLQKNNPTLNYTNSTSMQYSSQLYNEQHQTSTFNKNSNKTQDYEHYKVIEDYSHKPPPSSSSNFLPINQSKGIPGLDLVPESERPVPNKQYEIIDVTEENPNIHHQQKPVAPDYSKISKGINSILGDEKIMNILSMVSQKSSGDMQKSQDHWDGNNKYYKSNQQNSVYNQHASNNYCNNEQGASASYSDSTYNYTREDMSSDIPQNQYFNAPNQYGTVVTPQPNGPPRQVLQTMPQGNSEYSHQHNFERHKTQEIGNQLNEPVKPKWVHEPLFTPSIIVDYEHKPLRLKARDFIEPVHMFDYHHTSKNDENINKKDFGKEVVDLFVRKSRRRDDEDWSNFDKAYERRPARDDTRARSKTSTRDDNDIYNRRGYDRYEERRRDDRDRLIRDDHDKRDRGNEYDRTRDRDYGRERDTYRDRDPYRERDGNRDREYGRDRDFGRERDLARDRDLGRDRDIGRDRDVGRDRDIERDRDLDKDLMRDRERDIGRDRDFGRERDRDLGRDRDFGRERDALRDRESGRDKNNGRDRYRERKDDFRNRSRSRERDNRKREHSKDNDSLDSFSSKKSKDTKEDIVKNQSGKSKPQHIVMIDDLLEEPGRSMRPQKIVIILRGAPGSGKSYLAKLIRDKEGEHGGTARIMSIDDYFVQEGEIEETDSTTGKVIKKPTMKYEYDESLEETYVMSLKRAFKRTITDGYYTFLIYDAVNDQLKSYADIWNFARQNGFQVYICTMEMDPQTCFKRNIHKRELEEIEVITSRFFPTPAHHIHLDATTLLQSAAIQDVHMEDAGHVAEDAQGQEVESSFTSKWDKMDDAAQLARLDGTSKPLRPSQLSMEDYLQLDDWTPNKAKPGKKTVRWADIEERREQEKMRAIGFVVGQTDWNRMTDPTMGSSALTQTKYIERVRRF